MNFWNKIKKPILCLAPMADVTDAAFRFIVSKYSDIPHVTYTEFVSADGLILAPEAGRRKLLKGLEFSEIERPIVAQFFTSKPEMMEQAAALAVELGFDGVDINMGCPDKSIEKQKAGAALIKDPKLAREIILAAKQGILRCHLRKNPKGGTLGIPVSVKTRLGYNKDELESWLPELLAENPAAIVLHARTRKEMSKVPAHWERVKRAVEIRDELVSSSQRLETVLIGNGDVLDVSDAYQKCAETGADGAMIGRGIFGRPWLLSNSRELDNKTEPETAKKVLKILIEHTKLFEEKFEGFKSFALMKKFFKSYLSGIPDTKELREKLMQTENANQVEALVKDFLVLYN